MRKGLFLLGMMVISLGLFAKEASARLCLVSHEADTAGDSFTLRYHVNMIGRTEDEAFCTAVAGTFDEWLFVNTTGTPAQREETLTQHQIIWFATRQLGGYRNDNPVDLIVLTSQLRFRNSVVRMIIGNQPRVMPEESSYDYDYRDDYNPMTLLRRNYGLVTFDAHSLTGTAATTPLLCDADSREVILRNIAVKTANLTKEQLFASAPCLRDGGAVYVCPNSRIDTTKQPAQAGWCQEEEVVPPVEEEEDCDNGIDDGDDDGDVDCNDSECVADLVACPREDCTTADIDEDGDGLGSCDDPDCDEEPSCLDESLHCDDLLDNDGDSLGDCEDTEDCCSATNCSSQPQCQPAVPEAGNCADTLDNDGDGAVDCADSECASDPICLDLENCTNGIDDDGDTAIDCLDSDCSANAACLPVGESGYCADTLDNDGDGPVDCGDADCATDAACVIVPPPVENCTNGADDDGDTKIDCLDTDCLVSDACQVVATETGYCADTLDNDGDGSVDCADSDCSSLAACDVTDGGGDGVCGTIDTIDYLSVRGRVAVANCADPDCALLPECQERVLTEAGYCSDGVDNDDDGQIDCYDSNCFQATGCVENPTVAGSCSDGIDNDADGTFDCNEAACDSEPGCTADDDPGNSDDDGDGFSENAGDCDDSTPTASPEMSEGCDGIDNDCDGIPDETCQGEPDVDDDGDGFCESFIFCLGEAQPGDCDDNNDQVNPGETEICDDEVDNNCDGHKGSADDLEGIDLDSGDEQGGDVTLPGVPAALMRIARQGGGGIVDAPVITIEDSTGGDPTQPVIAPECEISVPEGDSGEGGGGCGCDLSGRNSPSKNPLVWFPFVLIPLGFLLRLRVSKEERPTPSCFR